jgi:hypothetical protein
MWVIERRLSTGLALPTGPDGNPDVHIHPLEPRTFRVTLSKTF